MTFALGELTDSGDKALGKILHSNKTTTKIKVGTYSKFSSEEKINFLREDLGELQKEQP